MAVVASQRQLNVRVDSRLFRALEGIARRERRSVPQTARLLLEEALERRAEPAMPMDDAPSERIAELANVGGAFDWLRDEPDVYSDSMGEPL